jgi:hypothetical protein
MKIQSFLHTPSYRGLILLVPALGSMAFAVCASAAGTAGTRPTVNVRTGSLGKHPARGHVTIGPRTYNPETENFDGSWPFGPESNAP